MKEKYIKALLAVLIVATVVFIFCRSLLPPEASKAESDTVGDIIAEIIPPETDTGEFVQINLRKIAHFTEFFVLGTEVSLFVVLYMRKHLYMALSIPAALLTALFDETIQIFSGRGPSIKDVWIDAFGFATASLIIYTVCLLIVIIRKKCKQ